MDEARRVLARLERINGLKEAGAEPKTLLAEMRALLVEGEAWACAEGEAAGGGAAALERLSSALGQASPPRAA
jgi:hypothetical protein